jgi:hypothetical protein
MGDLAPTAPPARAIVQDGDAGKIRLALYDSRDVIGTTMLDIVHMIGLMGELITAAHRRVTRGAGHA